MRKLDKRKRFEYYSSRGVLFKMMKSKLKPRTNRVMNPFAAISVILCSMTLSYCSLQPSSKDHATLYFQNEESRFASDASGSLNLTGAIGALTAPEPSQFKCIGVNVVGEGISSVNGPQFVSGYLEPLINGNSSCSYTGVTSPTVSISQNADIQLEVPTGPKRVVQVIGFADPGFCSQYAGSPMNVTQGFELGHAVIDLFSSQAVTVANTYPVGSGTTDPAVDAARQRRFVNCTGGTGPVAAFDPLTISNLAHWYKADELTSGTVVWIDKGGNTANLSQSGSMTLGLFHGHTIVKVGGFSGAARNYTSNSAYTNSSSGITVFMMSQLIASGTGNTLEIGLSLLESGYDGTNGNFYSYLFSTLNQVTISASGPGNVFSPPGSQNNFHVHRIILGSSSNPAGLNYSVGGHNGTPYSSTAPQNLSTITIGDLSGSAEFNVAEVLVYERLLTQAEQDQVTQYLNQKYALVSP